MKTGLGEPLRAVKTVPKCPAPRRKVRKRRRGPKEDIPAGVITDIDTDTEDDVPLANMVPGTPLVGPGVDTDKVWKLAKTTGGLSRVEWGKAIWKIQDQREVERAGAEYEKDRRESDKHT